MTVIVDLYSGPGGVGYALDSLGFHSVGVDIKDYGDTYPGAFVQGDASRPPVDVTPDLLWLSPPCLAYSTLSYANKNRLGFDDPRDYYPTFDDLKVRQVINELDPDHYIIENVATCEELRDPVRLDGLAFGLGFRLERHFETSFHAPDALGRGLPEEIVNTRQGVTQSEAALADRKSVPRTWSKQEIRSAIAPEFVQYLLHYCPSTPGVECPPVDRQWSLPEIVADGGITQDAEGRTAGGRGE